MAGHSTPGALADARVGPRVRGLHVQLLRGDGGGVQEAGDGAVQLLQQHLTDTETGVGVGGNGERRRGPGHTQNTGGLTGVK